MIRKSEFGDIAQIERIYNKIHDKELTLTMTGWRKGIYPARQTAIEAHNNSELFVMDVEGKIVAAAIINQTQTPEYADCNWEFKVQNCEVMVLHTLVVDPDKSGKGYASNFVAFYENYALENGCRYLRMDTNVINTAARKLYNKLGYKEPGIIACDFNGIVGVRLVCLEKRLNVLM